MSEIRVYKPSIVKIETKTGQPVVDLEAQRLELLKAEKLSLPDIAGAEAVELVSQRCNTRTALTRENLNNRAFRLSQTELNQLVEAGDWLEWFHQSTWRDSFVARGEITSATEEITTEYTLLFPEDLGTQEEYEEAANILDIWNNRATETWLEPLFKDVDDETEQRRILLSYMSQ